MHKKETPVFFDRSGKRWAAVENCVVLIMAITGILVNWLAPLALAYRQPISLPKQPLDTYSSLPISQTPSVEQLLSFVGSSNIAVIGSGPLVRLVQIQKATEGTFATNPFTGEGLKKLTDNETRFIGDDSYAIQRYGEIGDKRLLLTFDDGPDITYTPQLLDLLSSESVPVTFFVSGNNVAMHPDIAKRIIREGHSIGNHTFSHIDFNTVEKIRGEQEINQTQRLIIAATSYETAFFRPPYGGSTDQSLRNSLKGILTAQQLGYSVASYDFDSNDWHFPSGTKPIYPVLDGKAVVILLHDGGGDRTKTIAYVKELIHQAKSKGYSFATFDDIYLKPQNSVAVQPTLADHVSLISAQAVLVWPHHIINWLFVFSVGSLIAISLVNIILAVHYKARKKFKPLSRKYRPEVTVILPAYNEETVLEKSIRSLARSRYRKLKIVIVDDGSTDKTWQTAKALAKRYKRVSALHQKNGGKASALNNAINRSKSDIVICADADTIFPPQTILHLIRHFEDESVGAVAGVVKVGNPNSMLTKWQAIEYAIGIAIERNAQATLGAITIVPGACGAWRRSLLVELGGFSTSTLAEDCDLALKIQSTRSYRIIQDNEAISYTEAPQFLSALTKQRFRWTFGSIQSLWKHHSMVLNRHHGWLGMYVMPSMIIALIVPIIFWPLVIGLTVANILSGDYLMILFFFTVSLAIQILISLIGIALSKEKYSYLLAVPFGRIIYGPIRIYILYKTIITILKGVDVGWNKLARTGTVSDAFGTQKVLATTRPKKRRLRFLNPQH